MSKAAVKAAANPPALIEELAGKHGLDAAEFRATIMATCMPDIKREPSEEEFAALLMVAREYDLNPLLKEIYAFPTRAGGIAPVVGVDGWIALINRHAQFAGVEFEMTDDKAGNPLRCLCRIFRKDRDMPIVIEEYFKECARNTDPWKSMPHRMLRHKALIQCARLAFGFSGIYDEDEARDQSGGERIIVPGNASEPQENRPKLIDLSAEQPENTPEESAESDETPEEAVGAAQSGEGDIPAESTPEAPSAQEPPPSEADSGESPEFTDADFFVELEYGPETGAPREKAYAGKVCEMIEAAEETEHLDMIWSVNSEDIAAISAHWRKKIIEAGKQRREALA